MASVIFSKSSDVNNSIFGKSQEPVRAVITQGVESFEAKSLHGHLHQLCRKVHQRNQPGRL